MNRMLFTYLPEVTPPMLSRASHVSPEFLSAQDDVDRGRRPLRRHARVLGASLALCGVLSLTGSISLLAVLPAGAESLPARCDKVAAPTGSDSANGSAATPLRTVSALANGLAPGQVGCLRAGVYGGGLRVNHGGVAGAPIGLRSYPGEHATITGRIYVPAGSNYVTFEGLSLDGNYQSGERLPSPTVNANHVTFESDDVTNDHTGICFDIGSATWGFADSTVIAHNRIHDCGVLPSTNQQHGIYVQDATNTQIVGNVIVNNVDRGIQLYPNSTGAVITGNVIANNGEGVIFSGEGASSNGNLVEHNLIVNSQIRRDVESWYPSGTPRGVGNLVRANCVSTRGIDTSSGGFSVQGNVTVTASELIATGEGGYSAAPGSACADVLGSVAGAGAPEALPVGKEEGSTAAAQRQVELAAPAEAATHAVPAAGPGPAQATLDSASHAARPGSAHAHHARHAKHKHTKHRFAKRRSKAGHGSHGHHG
jgi:parallel beta-helix repeat protein